MGDYRSIGALRGLAVMCTILCAALGGCASSIYAAIAPTDAAAPADVRALALRAGGGDKRAQYELGERYERGDGVTRDRKRALALYRQAASTSGGTLWIYAPPVGRSSRGGVLPLDRGPIRHGLPEARQRLAELETHR